MRVSRANVTRSEARPIGWDDKVFLWFAPDATGCPDCGDEDLSWAEASGDATLVTWTVLPKDPPAQLALVELAEGPWLHARLGGVARDDLREGLPLRVAFEYPDEGESYILFRP